MKLLIEEKFGFLKSDYGFSGPFYWNLAQEQEYTFVKEKHFFTIGFDGGFNISIGKTSNIIPELSTWQVTLKDIKYEEQKSVYPFELLSDEEINTLRSLNNPEEELDFWVNVIKGNSEIILGDWNKFSTKHKLKKSFSKLFQKK